MRGHPSAGPGGWRRTVLVVVLVALLATCVALVLAQSAGLIDLPLLGPPSAQSGAAPGGVALPRTARLAYSPAKRSSSWAPIGPSWLRAST